MENDFKWWCQGSWSDSQLAQVHTVTGGFQRDCLLLQDGAPELF